MTAPDVRTPGGNLANAEENTERATSVDDDELEVKRLVNLQHLAASVGASLNRVATGYMLCCGQHSWHSQTLDAFAVIVKRLGVRR